MTFTVPIEPPTVNHYVKHTRSGRHYKTAEAFAWEHACRMYIHPSCVLVGDVRVEYTVFQGKGSRGDVDNYAKCILDALVDVGAIKSDSQVTDLIARKRRDRENPRTEIDVVALLEGA